MFYLFFCGALLSIVTNVVHGTLPELPEGLTVHKECLEWDQAIEQCRREGGTLASPINGRALSAIQAVIGDYNITYFIGIKAIQSIHNDLPGQFVSSEGVPLASMPLAVRLDMIQHLDQQEGECLAMDKQHIRAVPCWTRLPYLCYDSRVFAKNKTYCGPPNEGYKYAKSTDRCYSLHLDTLTWDQASWTCAAEGGSLVVLDDAKEAATVCNIYGLARDNYIFIGIRRQFGKQNWKSIHGQPLEQLYNVRLGLDSLSEPKYQCGALHSKSGKWENIHCNATKFFICEKDPTFQLTS